MKKIAALFLTLAIICSFSFNAGAQSKAKPKTEVTSVKQKGETVRFTLTSSKPFIFGNNKYYLLIGSKEITRNEQSKMNGKGILSFLIPSADFSKLEEGAAIYLTYGHVDAGETDMEQLAQKSGKCWSLGKFSKTMLKK